MRDLNQVILQGKATDFRAFENPYGVSVLTTLSINGESLKVMISAEKDSWFHRNHGKLKDRNLFLMCTLDSWEPKNKPGELSYGLKSSDKQMYTTDAEAQFSLAVLLGTVEKTAPKDGVTLLQLGLSYLNPKKNEWKKRYCRVLSTVAPEPGRVVYVEGKVEYKNRMLLVDAGTVIDIQEDKRGKK